MKKGFVKHARSQNLVLPAQCTSHNFAMIRQRLKPVHITQMRMIGIDPETNVEISEIMARREKKIHMDDVVPERPSAANTPDPEIVRAEISQ